MAVMQRERQHRFLAPLKDLQGLPGGDRRDRAGDVRGQRLHVVRTQRCVELHAIDATRSARRPSDANDFDTTCAAVSGVFTPAVTESETTRTCANDNGRCCNHYNKREDSHRTTLIILLKTPYAIGTIAALFLHLLLPEDRVLDEEKEHYPRAFSDGEIAYET